MYDLQSPNPFKKSGGEKMAKMTKEAASRIQSSIDKSGGDKTAKARVQRAAETNTKKK